MALAPSATGMVGSGVGIAGSNPAMMPAPNMNNIAQWKPNVGSGSSHTHGSSCNTGGCGGAYDLRAFERRQYGGSGICMGVDFGTSQIRAGVWEVKDDGKAALNACVLKGGGCTGIHISDAASLSKWIKSKKKGDSLPKGCKLTSSKNLSEKESNGVVVGIKRMIGNGAVLDIPSFLERPGFLSFHDDNEKDVDMDEFESPTVKLMFEAQEVECKTEDLLALVMVCLKKKVSKAYEAEVGSVVVTVPSIFTDRQRVAVQAALFKAGLHPRRMISSPIAALVGAIESPPPDERPVLDEEGPCGFSNEASLADHVYNARAPEMHALCVGMGAGFSEVGVVKLSYKSSVDDEGQETGYLSYKMLSVDGMVYGGMDLDHDICQTLYSSNGDQTPGLTTIRGAREAVSTKNAVKFTRPVQQEDGALEPKEWILERDQLERIMKGPLESLKKAASSAMSACKIGPDKIDFVLTFGGVSKTPAFMEMAKSLTATDKLFNAGLDAQCRGATYFFATLEGMEGCGDLPLVALDVLPAQLAVQTSDGLDTLFPNNTLLPATVEREYEGEVKSDKLVVVQTTCDNNVIPAMKITHPQIIPDDERGDTWHANSASVRFSLDESGVLRIERIGDEPTRPKPPLSWMAWLIRVLLAVLAFGFISWRLYYKFVVEVAQLKVYRTRLVAFYDEVNPEKMDTVDEILLKYKGREELLIRKLEKKYDLKIPTVEDIELKLAEAKLADEDPVEEVSFDLEQDSIDSSKTEL